MSLAAFLLAATLTLSATPPPGPGALERGEKLLARKQYAAAETELRKAVEESPKSARAYGNLVLALLAQRKTKEAVNAGRLAAAFGPDSPEARYIYGVALAADGKQVDAAREFEKAAAFKPGVVPPLAALAAAYAAAEDDRTVATYEKLIALEPGDARIRGAVAEYLWRTGKTSQGNQAMEEALHGSPSDVELLLRFGRSLAEQERFVDAAAALEKARRYGSAADAATWLLLARCYEQAGQPEAARTALTESLQSHPRDADLQRELGRLLLGQGDAAAALPHLEEAATARPKAADIQLDFGRALEATGKLNLAEEAYRRALKLSPNLPGAHYALGRLLQRQGKKEEAETELAIHHALYERARELVAASEARSAEFALAWALLTGGNPSAALTRFAALGPSAESLRGEAMALSRLERHAEAVRALERARDLSPDDQRVALLLVTERSRAGAVK
jgi:Flp pilus assembly protein TadD